MQNKKQKDSNGQIIRDTVEKEHIKKALDHVGKNGVPANERGLTKFIDVGGAEYPLKYVFKLACAFRAGKDPAAAGEFTYEFTSSEAETRLLKFADEIGYRIVNGAEQMKKQFRKYMKNIARQDNSQPYAKNTVGAYIEALTYLGKQLKELNLYSKSVFDIDTIEELAKIREIYKANSQIKALLTARNNASNTSSGLSVYEKFLIYAESESPTPLTATETNPVPNLKAENIIFYGVPGSGKSYSIKERVNNTESAEFGTDNAYDTLVAAGNISKIVFHPDYTYSDFVGQISPDDNNGVLKYPFKPGPFTNILKKAIKNPQKPYLLVIEEINRGNAAAIFGDIFQLLDRDETGKSEYPITNQEIAKIVHSDSDQQIFIPNNLWLFATMNTSDQNVFTLDTAFQRRWEMELVPNKFDHPDLNFTIAGTAVTWKKFAKTTNDHLKKQSGVLSSEDKLLGAWFVKADSDGSNTISKKRFANKVLKYLWDDAFKFERSDFFSADYKTLDDVIRAFYTNDSGFDTILQPKVHSLLLADIADQND